MDKILEETQRKLAEISLEIAMQKMEYEREAARLKMEKAKVELEQAKEIKGKVLANLDAQLAKSVDFTS